MRRSSSPQRGIVSSFVAALITLALLPPAANAERLRAERPVPGAETRVSVDGLGPVTMSSGETAHTSLRLFNPHPFAVTATVGAVDLELAPLSVLETRAFTGSVVVQSKEPIVVTSRTSDASAADAVDASLDVQQEARDAAQRIGVNATVPIATNSVACQNGTSWAYVDPVPGATYEWTTVNTNVIEGAGTNLVKLAHGGATLAAVSVTVTANAISSTGSASIELREPFRIASLFPAAASVTAGQPVTLAWSFAGAEVPRAQTLKINGTAVAVSLTDRSYTFTPTVVGPYTVELIASTEGGRRRIVRHESPLPPASSCSSDVRTTSFVVENNCPVTNGSVNVVGDSIAQGSSTFVIVKAQGSWTLSSDLGNTFSRIAGIGNASVTYTASIAGVDTIRLRLSGDCIATVTDTVTVTAAVPAARIVSFTASPQTIGFGAGSVIEFNIENATTWTLRSSLGNVIIGTQSGTTSGRFVRVYQANRASGVDNLKLTVTGGNGEVLTQTVQITITP